MLKMIIIKVLNYYIILNVLGYLRVCYLVWKLLVFDSICEGLIFVSCIFFFYMFFIFKDVC